jgi:hypothetical protein
MCNKPVLHTVFMKSNVQHIPMYKNLRARTHFHFGGLFHESRVSCVLLRSEYRSISFPPTLTLRLAPSRQFAVHAYYSLRQRT